MPFLAIDLPDRTGSSVTYMLSASPIEVPDGPLQFNRKAFSAVHVVADPMSDLEPSSGPAIDWEATLSFRQYILDLGLGVAEAMDTAQRGMGLDWPAARELIERSLEAATPARRGRIVCGVGTDHLDPNDARGLDDVVAAYLEQFSVVQKAGGRAVLMASRALARIAASPADYEAVYARVLAEADAPVILHWLGEMFDPALAGYWGAAGFSNAIDTVLAVIHADPAKVDGIKVSLLDERREVALRRSLPNGVRMYTGDDFNYPTLIEGDDHGHSDALLGIFDPVAPAASTALAALAGGDMPTYRRTLNPTVPLSRLIFRAPTRHYKTGIVFLAYLNGFQDHFVMIGGAQAMRPLPYFSELFRLADAAGLLRDPELAVARMRLFLGLYGIES